MEVGRREPERITRYKRAGMPRARQNAMPRCAKSRQTPARWIRISLAVVLASLAAASIFDILVEPCANRADPRVPSWDGGELAHCEIGQPVRGNELAREEVRKDVERKIANVHFVDGCGIGPVNVEVDLCGYRKAKARRTAATTCT